MGQTLPTTVTTVPSEITWRTRPGETVAHAYSSGAGWMRSVCRREPWSVLWAEAAPEIPHCFECAELLAGDDDVEAAG